MPQERRIALSTGRLFGSFFTFLGLSVVSGILLYVFHPVIGWWFRSIFWLGTAFFLFLTLLTLPKFFHRRSGLMLDQRGIHCPSFSVNFRSIPWEEIVSSSIETTDMTDAFEKTIGTRRRARQERMRIRQLRFKVSDPSRLRMNALTRLIAPTHADEAIIPDNMFETDLEELKEIIDERRRAAQNMSE